MAGNMFNVLFDELLRIWQYRWLILGAAALIFCSAALYILRMPNIYEASAQIYVNKETPVSTAAHGISLVGDNFGSAYVVQKTLLNDQYLKTILTQTDPRTASMDQAALLRAIAALRARIRIDPDQGDGFVQIHFQDADPVHARNVVRMLLDQFIAANLTRSRIDLGRASQFLDQQIAAYGEKSRAADAELMDFSRKHPGIARSSLAAQVGDAVDEVASARAAYSAALSGKSSGGQSGPPSPGSAEIAALNARIAVLRTQYTAQYPDVVAAQRQLDALLAAQSATATAAPALENQSAAPSEAHEARAAHGALLAAQARLRQAQQGPPPSPLDAQWADLKKNSAILRGNYEEIMSRREAARLSQAVYADKNSGKYQITAPPTVPPIPSGPNRRLYLLLAGIIALGTGVGMAYLRGAINGILVAPRELEDIFGLPVAGTVSLEKTWQTDRRPIAGRNISLAKIGMAVGWTGLAVASEMAMAEHGAVDRAHIPAVEIEMADNGGQPPFREASK
jgi:polysaccharide chain length determinant protein (PEP-CTERM system associated)